MRKPQADAPATRDKNYISRSGQERLKDEHRFLPTRERPAVTEVVAWAAGNGDRSENGDYQYGKRRLRQIDGRIRFLTKRIEAAEVVDPEAPRAGQVATRAFFGATVRYANAAGVSRVVSIVGTDEVDLNRNHISWESPLGRALMNSAAGDSVVPQLPGGTEYLTVLEVCYERISVEPFREPAGSEASAKELPVHANPPAEEETKRHRQRKSGDRNSAISAFGKRQEMSRVLIPRLDSLFEATSKRSAAQQFRCIRAVFSAKKLMFA